MLREQGQAPLCKGCNHHHEQGVKCEICGHVGQSNLYSRMCKKARQVDYQVLAQDSFADEDLMRRVVRQLCQQVGELDDKEEEGSRRLVGFLGDLPVWTARWRLIHSSSPSSFVALVDQVITLPDYQQQHISSSSADHVFTDIQQFATNNNIHISQVAALVPVLEGSWIDSKLVSRGFDTSDKTVQCMRGNVPHYHAVLNL